ncbi:ribosome biogenesis GTPase Der [Planctomycetaceae bacterium]|jgi:GTPase|nr:ribosome biogenesis GTPase Der [Planctomycetaceae bacterium]MDC0307610.1 ribosome biogenesis GTPase Der [Planctomycetaceae bacterium]MDG2388483.1 ribosome biogenesis GTPase Der [Planctomycetaceae bacterium]
MSIPRVAIVGRPNVGKSSILNWMARKLVSVVDPTAGVTRDRVTYTMNEFNRYFELIDTGGIGIVDSDDLSEQIEEQIRFGLEQADLLALVVDGQQGITPLDQTVARKLQKIGKPTMLIVNKCDSSKLDAEADTFRALVDTDPVIVSVKGERNRRELLEAIVENLPPADETEAAEGEQKINDPELKIAIVGRRNVGKSTFINALAEEERVIVSPIAGTTRDSIDIRFEVDEKSFIAIDTPGVRKRKSLANDIEFYGLVRAQKSIRRADVVLMFFDASERISRVDKKLVTDILDHAKPCIFVVNKWDLGLDEDMTTAKWAEYLLKTFPSTRYVPVAFITAKDSTNIKKVVNLAQTIFKQAQIRISTSKINKSIRKAVDGNQPPHRRNRRPKIYFATQVAIQPPTIIIKCNDPILFDESWKRYLESCIRDDLPFDEVPMRLYWRPRTDAIERAYDDAIEDVPEEFFDEEE